VNIQIEAASADDAPAIATILSGWIDETEWMPRIHTHEQDQGFGRYLIEVTEVAVARHRGQVVGFLARQGRDVQALYLARDARRKGVGSALLDHAKSQSDHLRLYTFQANHAARAFYAHHGFAEDHRTDGAGNDEKLPDICLTWERGDA